MSKSIFMTGITSGIGHEVYKRCRKEGFNITGIVRKEEQKLALQEDGVKLLQADMAIRDQVDKVAFEIKNQAFDYVLLNAGCANTGKFDQLPVDSIDRIMEVNLISNMLLVHALLPMALKTNTKIVFVSSIVAHLPANNYASYATSKAGLSKFCNSLRRECPSLQLLCVEIGPVDTPLHDKSNNIVKDKSKFKSQEDIGKRLFDAMMNKTGVVTLSWDWYLIRKIAMATEDLLTSMMVRKAS